MLKLKKVVDFFGFVAGGIIAIAVGFFMLRGTMRMWDRNKNEKNESDENFKKS